MHGVGLAAASIPTDFLSFTASADPDAGQSIWKFILGTIDGTSAYQRHLGDIYWWKGETYTRRAIYAMSYSVGVFSYTYRDETFVNGILYLVGAEQTQNVFSTGPCVKPS